MALSGLAAQKPEGFPGEGGCSGDVLKRAAFKDRGPGHLPPLPDSRQDTGPRDPLEVGVGTEDQTTPGV